MDTVFTIHAEAEAAAGVGGTAGSRAPGPAPRRADAG
jgi:hypothetical protein